MTTVPGTYFTKELLEAVRKDDKVSDGGRTGSDRMKFIGYIYQYNKKYDKALAWYLLAARDNYSAAYNHIGILYRDGLGVPQNYLCALKWYLKTAEHYEYENTPNNIGDLFEKGYGVPLDKYKALEWFCHGGDKSHRGRLKDQGYHRSATDKNKSLQQLRNETEAILDAEKKKLEWKQNKTQEEKEALVDLNITYKLTGGSQNAWKDVPILLATSKQRYTNLVNSSITNKDQETLELKEQIQLLKQEKSILIGQTKELPPIKHEDSNFQLEIKEKDRQLTLLRNDFQLIHHKNATFQQQITSLQKENQELQLKTNSLEQQAREKDDKINVLENEQHGHHRTSIQQTQMLNSLKQDKQVMEQDKTNVTNEMERLKSSYAILEQLLKSKEDVILSLNRENQTLSTANQGNQQGANDMVETLKNLLQGRNNEIDLLKQNMEHLLANEQQRNDVLEQEIRALKQERTQQQATIQNTGPSNNNINPTNNDPSHHDHHDDSYNDLNYESEYSDTEESDGDDINYDTPSEDEDSNNDLNYDDVNESNK